MSYRTTIFAPATVFLFVTAGGLVTSNVRAANEAGGEAKISQVTVFNGRAFVTRAQKVSVPAGALTVVFKGISPTADKSSVKVSLSGSNLTDILGIRFEEQHFLESQNPMVLALEKQLKSVQVERSKIVDKVTALVRNNSNLSSLAQYYQESFSIQLQENKWDLNKFRSFLELIRNKRSSMQSAWEKFYRRFSEIEKKALFIEAKILENRTTGDKKTLTVLVDLVGKKLVHQKITLKYMVNQAGWEPAYDLRIEKGTAKATLEQYAYVWQNSGEDWRDIKLELSNVRSELKPTVPSISSYQLNWKKVEKVKTSIKNTMSDATNLSVVAKDRGRSEDASGLAKTFIIAGRQTVNQGRSKTKVFVAKKALDYKEHLELVPSRYKKVYRKADLVNPFPWKLSSGPLNIFYNGGFLSKTKIAGVVRGGPFSLNVGVEHNLVVNYWQDKTEEKAGMISGGKKYRRIARLRLTNFGEKIMNIRVLEQRPLSEISAVKVTMTKETTPGYIEDVKHPGWFYWEVKPAARATAELNAGIEVEVPAEMQFSWN